MIIYCIIGQEILDKNVAYQDRGYHCIVAFQTLRIHQLYNRHLQIVGLGYRMILFFGGQPHHSLQDKHPILSNLPMHH